MRVIDISTSSILSFVLKQCKPTTAENKRMWDLYHDIESQITNISKNYNISDIKLGGSLARDTWLKDEADIDIFIKLRSDCTKKDLHNSLEIGQTVLKKYKPYLKYSDHPYVEAVVPLGKSSVKVNIVSCFDVQPRNWKSAADRSPFHTDFIKKQLTPKMRNEVRLLKTFLHANKLYGAEIKIQGFSGYVCEILILKYGGFIKLLRAMQKLDLGSTIILDDKDFIYSHLHDTLIKILDPVDPKRNLAMAISPHNLFKFIFLSNAFLNKPSKNYFKPRRVHLNHNLLDNVLLISFNHKYRSDVDNLWGQLRKSLKYINTLFENNDFHVIRSDIASNDSTESIFVFLLENLKLDNKKLHIGPSIEMFTQSIKFLNHNKTKRIVTWIGDDGRLYSLNFRKNNDISSLFKILISNEKQFGMSKGIKSDFKKNFKLITGESILSLAHEKTWLYSSLGDVIGSESHLS